MKVFITGATGFIGSHITHLLINDGHNVTCGVRNTHYAKKMFPEANIVKCDFVKDISPSVWQKRIENNDVLINAVGIFYHKNKDTIWNIHYKTPKALFEAAALAGVKEIIHLSALGIDDIKVEYATSKKAIEEYLLSNQFYIPSVILRPSVVYGNVAFGGMAFFRGLAGLPYIIPVPGNGQQQLQPIHVADLASAVMTFIHKPVRNKILLKSVGPEPIIFAELLKVLRKWLGFSSPFILRIPIWLVYLATYLGNLTGSLVSNTAAFKMLLRNNIANHEETKFFQSIIGFVPRNFVKGIFYSPSSIQDRWHAHLYFLKPMLRYSLAFIWIMSALTSAYLYPVSASYNLLGSIGVSNTWQPIALYGASIINALIGLALLFNFKIIQIGILQIVVILAYTLIITMKLPHLWLDPFGPIVKNIPILVAVLILMGLEGDE